ncbi:PREDICTED: uncharacterized protein LOC109468239 isoform X1 [Branchiostoma belcheri]|uniref:Uncharacterized protein LOC109468239 isoform X1 n=1 Tax=Branchiostoma belcheri TaxID=7741 RepID=A0A6P4YXQ2_BRABE|nr:PREDICTED: uncharacterized protein LOC109468239 isoform X1 [Branchiostoma belcheri]
MSTSQKHVTCLSRGQTTQEALLVFVQYFNKKATQSAMDVLLVNCDKTYSLESVEELIKVAKNACVGSNIRIEKQYCNVSQLQAVSEKVRQRRLLCGVLVVNAYESRLSINEEKAGIGYAVLYRALLEAAQGRVVVVIGGDDRYKAGEQHTSVLSTWAYHKIAAQFDDTYLDGRRGFVFSWDQRHNPVHEGALGSYLQAILSDKPGLEEPFKPSPPKVPPRPLPQLTTLPPSTPTDSEHNRLAEHQIGPHKGARGITNHAINVQNDPLRGTLQQSAPPHHTSKSPLKSTDPDVKHMSGQFANPNKTTALSIPFIMKGTEGQAAKYLKAKIEKETKGRIVKAMHIYLDSGRRMVQYDYNEGDVFPIPDYMRKDINEKKYEQEVVVAVIIDDGPRAHPRAHPPREDLGLIFLFLADLVDYLPPYFWQTNK